MITGFNYFRSMEHRETEVNKLEKEYMQSKFEALKISLIQTFYSIV